MLARSSSHEQAVILGTTRKESEANNWTIGRVLEAATTFLQKQKIDSARLNAELLLAYCLGQSRIDLYLNYNQPLNKQERTAYKRLILQRAAGEPLQYLLGSQPFRYLNLTVEAGVFIPRPETEILVEQVIQWLKRTGRSKEPLKILDIGTGSGAIALSLAYELSQAEVWATDISEQALALALRNASQYGLTKRLHFVYGSLFNPLSKELCFDVIVSNPPYIKQKDLENLPQEVQKEPKTALVGGIDGLDFYRAVAARFSDYLKKDGLLAFEVGEGQAREVGELFAAQGLSYEIVNDYNGLERVVLINENNYCQSTQSPRASTQTN